MDNETEVTTITLSDKAAWLKERLTGIGSSDAAAVVGISPWKTPYQLHVEKLGLADANSAETEAMRWGLLLEPIVAAEYERETGRPLRDPGRFTIMRSVRRPWMLATPDREVLTPNEHGCVGLVELKTAGPFRADEWEEGPPDHYAIQLQHQMAVYGCSWGSLAVLIGGQVFKWLDLPRHDRLIKILVEREEELWSRIQRLDPPMPSGRDLEVLAALHPKDSGGVITLPQDAYEWDRVYCEALAQLKHWEAVRDEAKALLQNAIGSATKGVLPDGAGAYTWKAQRRAEHAVPACEFRVLRRADR